VLSGQAAVAAVPGDRFIRAGTAVAAAAAVALAVASGISVGSGSKAAAVLPVAIGVGIVLTAVALTRFEAFILIMLVCRASIDLTKLSTGSTSAPNPSGDAAALRALDPASILAVLFLLAAMLWLVAQRHTQPPAPASGLRRALLAFAAAGAISVLGSARPLAGWLEALRILTAVTMFIVVERLVHDGTTLRRVLTAVYVSALFPLVYTVAGALAGGADAEVKKDLVRITGPFNQSNQFGRYLMVLLILGVAIWPHVSARWGVLFTAILVCCAGFLVLTYTRTALVGTVIGLVVVGAVKARRMLLVLLVVVLCTLLIVPQLSSRFTDLTAPPAPGERNPNTLAWRLTYWAEVLPLANANPVTGIGLKGTESATDEAKQPHNDFVRAYVETGLIGLGAYLAMLLAMVGVGIRAVRVSPAGSLARGVAAGFLGCTVAFIAVSLAANVVSNVVVLWYLYAIGGAAAAVVQMYQPATATVRAPARARPHAVQAAARRPRLEGPLDRPVEPIDGMALLRFGAVVLAATLVLLAVLDHPRAGKQAARVERRPAAAPARPLAAVDFERDVQGWSAPDTPRLARGGPGQDSRYALQLAQARGVTDGPQVATALPGVPAGRIVRGLLSVRAVGAASSVEVALEERKGERVVTASRVSVPLTGIGWRRLQVDHRVRDGGSRLALRVGVPGRGTGRGLLLDNVSVTALNAAGRGPSQQPAPGPAPGRGPIRRPA
jgi:putative inorganic carbon (HCO3(-)) transporter